MREVWALRMVAALALAGACAGGGGDGAATSGGGSQDGASTSGGPASGGADPSSAGTSGVDPSTSSGEAPPTTSAGSDTGTGEGDGLGPAQFDEGELDAPSHGGTITFQQIGAPGWYPSRRDPDVGPCDAYDNNGCCLGKHEIAGDQLTPWDEDLILTLRGPLKLKQFAVYQPVGGQWSLVSGWDDRAPGAPQGLAFRGNGTESDGFDGVVGTECLVNVSTDSPFACGAGSVPYCPAEDDVEYDGWAGSKLFVLLATMPHADSGKIGAPCSDNQDGNWYDAPWIGLSHGELVRAGAFSSCQCYAKNPDEWYLGDGCGQFNVLEVVNDNNQYQNFGVFSTNFFGYAGYVGEGPCGDGCDVTQLGPEVDLIDKGENVEAAQGAVATPNGGPGAALRRPADGYRYILVLMDTSARTVQLAIVHPEAVPAVLAPLLPGLPAAVPQSVVADALDLRLPQ